MKKILFTSLAVLGLGITGCSNEDLAWRKVALMKYVPLWEMLNRVLL